MSRYYIGQVHRSRKRRIVFACVVIGLLILSAGATYLYRQFQTDTKATTSNAPAANRVYNATPQSLVRISEPLFSMDLPAGWTKYTIKNQTVLNSPQYSFTSPSTDGRSLSVYIDERVPATLTVNKVVVVTPNGSHIGYTDVSDNCANFTRPSVTDPGSGVAAGQWQGVSFLCDLGNYTRNVIGTASSEGQNSLTLNGQTTGKHRVFLSYTDNSPSPDYSIFYAILNSFSFK